MEQTTLDWLLEGDPAIRWQVLRDLLGESSEILERERVRMLAEGWCAELLASQDEDGHWGQGIYSPKWTSTTYSLLLLRQLGLPSQHPAAMRACQHFFFRGIEKDGGINWFKGYDHSETCVNGMILTILSYFDFPDSRIHSVAEHLLRQQMPDGGWNCRRIRGATHSSFHTTISVLDGLSEYRQTYPQARELVQPALEKAHEFLLIHRLYQSHRTGLPAAPALTCTPFPPHWHYDFLRGLDYCQSTQSLADERMRPAIDLLRSKQGKDGRWILNRPYSGRVFFQIERTGKPSRWNTLRALRVLKWWEGQTS